jgi:hypothetical protein
LFLTGAVALIDSGVIEAFMTCLGLSPAVVGRPPFEKGEKGSGIRIVWDMFGIRDKEVLQGCWTAENGLTFGLTVFIGSNVSEDL